MLSCELSLYHCSLSANQQVQSQENSKKSKANSELELDNPKLNQTRSKGEEDPTTEAKQNFQAQPFVENAHQEEKFDLWELCIKDNHVLKDTEIERTIYPFVGPQKTIKAVENARAALENLYHAKGYQTVSVDVPEQDVINGVVYLQVVEGKVSRLRVTESHYFSLGKIMEAVPEIAEGKVPNFPVMQKQIEGLSNLSPDRTITPVLRAGETPGTLEVDLKVKDELPLHGRVELNGRNTSSTSRLRIVNSIHYDNLWQMLHSASFMYQGSPENSDEVDVFAGTYAMPLPYTDAKLALYAVSSSSNASVASAGALAVIGRGQIYGARLIKPLPHFDKFIQSLTLGVDYKEFKDDLRLIGSDSLITPISYLPFLAEYTGSVIDKAWQASFTLGLNFAVRGLVSDSNVLTKDPMTGLNVIGGEFETKRAFAKPNYAYITADANFSHDLPYESQLAGRVSGQIADSPLISNEQFSLGGMQSVRGYFETQALSDDGFMASLELRSTMIVSSSFDYIDKLQGIVFVDGGYGHIQHALPGNPSNYSLASTGVGIRFQVLKYLQGILDLGIPLVTLNSVQAGHPKIHFSIATEF